MEGILQDIRLLSKEQLVEGVTSMDLKKFRAKQIWEWLWKKGVGSFDQMTNLSKDLRILLDNQFVINKIQIDKIQYSNDGTIKSRFKLHDGHLIESVLIPVPSDNRFTVCISSQVGCSLSCSFCATGKMNRVRNLDPGEIYDQYQLVNKQALESFGHPLTNIVFMGMGEPLLAYKNVLNGIDRLIAIDGLNISPRRITVSTAGIAKMIRKLADDQVKFNLALSLHAADDIKRNKIMTINETNNLDTLMDALNYFHLQTKNKISFEYITLREVNDSLQDAENLSKLCHSFPVHVNIIEYNPVEGINFKKAQDKRTEKFAQYLRNKNVMVTIRRSRGKDIDAACGQLANI